MAEKDEQENGEPKKGEAVRADEAPQQPQEHEKELRSTAPVPVEEAAAEADVPVPPDLVTPPDDEEGKD